MKGIRPVSNSIDYDYPQEAGAVLLHTLLPALVEDRISACKYLTFSLLKMLGDLNYPLDRGWEPHINVERP